MSENSWFTIEELCYSHTAHQLGISNKPDKTQKEHLSELVDALNGIRDALGCPIWVTSGFRCKQLNAAVGGVKTSAHQCGYAADLQCKLDTDDMYSKIKEYLTQNDIKFDQCIIEKSGETEWVHFGLKNCSGMQRCQFLSISV